MGPSYSGQGIGKVLFLIWAILCILFFIIFPGKISFVHWANLDNWPLLPEKLERLDLVYYIVNFIRAFVGIIIFSVACISMGAFITKKFKIDNRSDPEASSPGLALIGTEFLLGHAIYSVIFLTLGGLYKITPAYIVLILSLGFLMGIGQINHTLKTLTDINSKLWMKPEGNRNKAIFCLSISIVLLSLLFSTARLSYDSSAVYFSDAKLSAMLQDVQYFRNDTFVASAFQSTIQFTALIQIFGDQAARLFPWVCGIIIIIFSIAIGERVGVTKQARYVLLTLLITSTAFMDLMGDGKVDLISSMPAIAAIYWMIVESQSITDSKSQLLLVGFFIGLAIVSRPFNAFLLGIFAILFYFQRLYIKSGFRPLSYKSFIDLIFWIGIGSVGLGIYHLFANWILLGNPLAFLSSISKIDASNGPWDYKADEILVVRMLYPFVATFYNSPQTLGNISPLFLAFLPAFFMENIRRKIRISTELFLLLVISIITLSFWIFLFFTVTEIRYVIFLWAILFIPLAEVVTTTLENQDRMFQNILSGLIIILLLFNIWRTIYIALDTYSPLDKHGNPQCYDSRFCQFQRPVNEVASPGDRILTLNAFRYYLRSDLFACSTKHQEYDILQESSHKNNTAFWSEVYRQGYKYVLYENDYTTRHLQFGMIPDPANVPDWINLKPLYGNPRDLQVAYEIQVKNPVIDAEFTCLKNTAGIWEVKPISR